MDSLMLTIIVPCYNAEKYIDRCLSSIYNQTYKNFECIVIDDGSTDNSATLCDKFSAKDSRFIIIHQENRGVSAARNAALDIARGEYIGFVDADDYIDVDHFELMLASAEKFKTDLVLCDVIAERNRQALWVSSYISEKDVLTKSEFMLDLLNDRVINGWTWNKLYKRHLFKDTRFSEEYKILEDFECMHRIFDHAKTMALLKKSTYHYEQVNNSLIHNLNVDRLWDLLYPVESRYLYIKKSKNDLYIKITRDSFAGFLSMFVSAWLKNDDYPRRMIEDNYYFCRTYIWDILISRVSIGKKIRLIFINMGLFGLYKKIYKIIHR